MDLELSMRFEPGNSTALDLIILFLVLCFPLLPFFSFSFSFSASAPNNHPQPVSKSPFSLPPLAFHSSTDSSTPRQRGHFLRDVWYQPTERSAP